MPAIHADVPLTVLVGGLALVALGRAVADLVWQPRRQR